VQNYIIKLKTERFVIVELMSDIEINKTFVVFLYINLSFYPNIFLKQSIEINMSFAKLFYGDSRSTIS